jgi:uncharacterized membrane-anchored protein YhcB (DUF1043 family)
MKYLKLSKTGWLILGVGVLIFVLAGLGITRSQQAKEQDRLDDELEMSQTSLANMQIADLQEQLADLEQIAAQEQAEFDLAANMLDQTVISVDVTDEFFSIASTCGVIIINISTSPIVPNMFEGLGLSATSVNAMLEGELPNLIDFVEALNSGFTTGQVKMAQIDIPPSSSNETASVNVQMTIYSYEENNDG